MRLEPCKVELVKQNAVFFILYFWKRVFCLNLNDTKLNQLLFDVLAIEDVLNTSLECLLLGESFLSDLEEDNVLFRFETHLLKYISYPLEVNALSGSEKVLLPLLKLTALKFVKDEIVELCFSRNIACITNKLITFPHHS